MSRYCREALKYEGHCFTVEKKKQKKNKKTRASWDYCYQQYTHGLYLSYQSHYRLLVKSIPPAILDPHENFGVVRVGSIRFNWPSTRLYATIVCTFQKQIIVKNTNGTWSESHTRRLNTISRVYTNGTTRPGALKKMNLDPTIFPCFCECYLVTIVSRSWHLDNDSETLC